MGYDQHFMKDEDVLSRIVDVCGPRKDEVVFEIGAGLGSLTRLLAKGAKKVYAVEIDPSLGPSLFEMAKKLGNIEVAIGNALETEWPKFEVIASNLPYSISEPVVQKLVFCRFRKGALLVSGGFASILLGKKRTKLTFIAEAFFNISEDITVYPPSFEPEPKVNSVLLIIEPKEPKEPKEAILQEFLRQKDKISKNALREAIIRGFGRFGAELTKKQARELTGDYPHLGSKKKVYALSHGELEETAEFIGKLVFGGDI